MKKQEIPSLTGKSMKRKKGFFSISGVAEMFSIHQQTIRLYEREGLIAPKRSEGNTRLFSEEDVNKLEEIIHLTHKLGVNLAGVQMILKLQTQIKKMQKDMNRMFEATSRDLKKEQEHYQHQSKETAATLSRLQKKQLPIKEQSASEEQETLKPSSQKDIWEIDYNE